MTKLTTAERARQVQRDATRDAIIRAGIELLSKHGLEGVKITNVAKEAGLANGTFYLYFKDRQALYDEIVDRLVMALARRLSEVHGAHANTEQGNSAEVEAFVDFVEENPHFVGAFWADGPNGRAMGMLVAQREAELREMQRDGTVRADIDVTVMARSEAYLLLAVLAWWETDRTVTREVLIDSLSAYRRTGTANQHLPLRPIATRKSRDSEGRVRQGVSSFTTY